MILQVTLHLFALRTIIDGVLKHLLRLGKSVITVFGQLGWQAGDVVHIVLMAVTCLATKLPRKDTI